MGEADVYRGLQAYQGPLFLVSTCRDWSEGICAGACYGEDTSAMPTGFLVSGVPNEGQYRKPLAQSGAGSTLAIHRTAIIQGEISGLSTYSELHHQQLPDATCALNMSQPIIEHVLLGYV